MFGKVKKILGIEGVKLELILPDKISAVSGIITGIVKLTSISDDNIIESIKINLVEKYARGRGENRLVNEYVMGELVRKDKIVLSKNDIVEIPFEMDFVFVQSEMDKLADTNFLVKGIVGLAKKAKGVKSEYTIKAEAKVKGTTLHPFNSQIINLIK